MLPYINFHTHMPLENGHDDCLSILNYTQKDNFDLKELPTNQYYSIGLHPWYVTKENFAADFEKLTQYIGHKKVLAIGECGLDALKGENLAFQKEVLAAQIDLATFIQKPIIIHCVKAYNELIALKKQKKPRIPMIVHGFNQNATILQQLLKNDFYISIGVEILMVHPEKVGRGGSHTELAIRNMPIDHLFLENDDKNVPISAIYAKASKILGLDIETLKRQICDNFNRILTPNSIL
jgi:TatD DNase family protein